MIYGKSIKTLIYLSVKRNHRIYVYCEYTLFTENSVPLGLHFDNILYDESRLRAKNYSSSVALVFEFVIICVPGNRASCKLSSFDDYF